MKKTNKKGFTLVELLVVIAILAILATVSVVGYLGFTQKARESKVQTELVQIRDVITGELISGDKEVDSYTFSLADGKLLVDGTDIVADAKAAMVKLFTDITADMWASLSFEDTDGADNNTITIEKMTYTIDDASAVWNIADASVTVA